VWKSLLAGTKRRKCCSGGHYATHRRSQPQVCCTLWLTSSHTVSSRHLPTAVYCFLWLAGEWTGFCSRWGPSRCAHRFLERPRFPPEEHRRILLRGYSRRNHYILSSIKLKMHGASPPLPRTPTWNSAYEGLRSVILGFYSGVTEISLLTFYAA